MPLVECFFHWFSCSHVAELESVVAQCCRFVASHFYGCMAVSSHLFCMTWLTLFSIITSSVSQRKRKAPNDKSELKKLHIWAEQWNLWLCKAERPPEDDAAREWKQVANREKSSFRVVIYGVSPSLVQLGKGKDNQRHCPRPPRGANPRLASEEGCWDLAELVP